MRARTEKSGGVLVMVLVVMVALTLLSIGLFGLADHDGREAIQQKQSVQAFWLAESGLQQTLEKILTDKNYRASVRTSEAYADDPDGGSPYDIDIAGDGSIVGKNEVMVWKNGNDYHIYSQGEVRGMKRRLYLLAENVRPDLSYAIMVLDGEANIWRDGEIKGSLYTWGDLILAASTTVSGNIFAKNVPDGSGWLELTSEVEMVIAGNNQFENALTAAPGNGVATIPKGNIDLGSGGSVIVEGDLSVNGNITGSGTLVVTGDLDFSKDYEISDDVNIVVGNDVDFSKDGEWGTNVNMYVKGWVNMKKGNLTAAGMNSLVILGTNKQGDSFDVDKDLDFSGLIYADGNVRMKKAPVLTGSLIAGGDLEFRQDGKVKYDPSVIPSWIYESVIIVERFDSDDSWDELPPL